MTDVQIGAISPPPITVQSKPSRNWPIVIGVLSLTYAIGGLFIAITLWLQFKETLDRGRMYSPNTRVQTAVIAIVTCILGIWMVVGAIMLLCRRRSGVWLLRTWARLRIMLVVIATVWLIASIPSEAKYMREHRTIQENPQWQLPQRRGPTDAEVSQMWTTGIVFGGLQAIAFAVYPVFLFIYLGQRRITADMETWAD